MLFADCDNQCVCKNIELKAWIANKTFKLNTIKMEYNI